MSRKDVLRTASEQLANENALTRNEQSAIEHCLAHNELVDAERLIQIKLGEAEANGTMAPQLANGLRQALADVVQAPSYDLTNCEPDNE